VGSVVDINFPPRITAQGIQEVAILEQFKEGAVWLRGPARQGKTGTAVAIAHGLREHYGKLPILDFLPYEAFGEHKYMGLREIIPLLEKIGDIIEAGNKEGVSNDIIRARIEAKVGFSIENLTWVLDEAYKYLRKMRSTSKVVVAFSDLIAVCYHFHWTVIICTPGREISTRVSEDQEPIELICSFNLHLKEVHAHGWNPRTSRAIHLYTPMEIYGKMYDSTNPQAIMRSKQIKIKGNV